MALAPRTPKTTLLNKRRDEIGNRNNKTFVSNDFTDSINYFGAVPDADRLSINGRLRDKHERKYPTYDARMGKNISHGHVTRLAKYAYGKPDPWLLSFGGESKQIGSGALGFGRGNQATYQVPGQPRFQAFTDITSGSFMARANKIGDGFRWYIQEEFNKTGKIRGEYVATAANYKHWQKCWWLDLDPEQTYTLVFEPMKGMIIFDGGDTYSGADIHGYRQVTTGRSGSDTQQHASFPIDPVTGVGTSFSNLHLLADDGVSGPNEVIDTLGTNEQGSAKYYDHKATVIEWYKKINPNITYWLALPGLPGACAPEVWLDMYETHLQLAHDYTNVGVIPLTDLVTPGGIGNWTPGGNPDRMIGPLHPNAYGYEIYSTVLFNQLTGATSAIEEPPTTTNPPIVINPTPPSGGTNPTPTVDTTGPTVEVVSPAPGFVVPYGGTVDFVFKVTDASGVGASRGIFEAKQGGVVIGDGSPSQLTDLGTAYYGHRGIPHSEIAKLNGSKWLAVFRDASAGEGNPTTVGPFEISAAAAPVGTTPTADPIISNVTPVSGTVFGAAATTWKVSATVTHALGLRDVGVFAYGSGEAVAVGALEREGSTNVWSKTFTLAEIKTSNRFAIVAAANKDAAGVVKTKTSPEFGFTFAAGTVVAPPTGKIISPAAGGTLEELQLIKVEAVDANGVAKVEIMANQFFYQVDADMISGTALNGVWEAYVTRDAIAALKDDNPTIRARITGKSGLITYTTMINVAYPTTEIGSGKTLAPWVDSETFDFVDVRVRNAEIARIRKYSGNSEESPIEGAALQRLMLEEFAAKLDMNTPGTMYVTSTLDSLGDENDEGFIAGTTDAFGIRWPEHYLGHKNFIPSTQLFGAERVIQTGNEYTGTLQPVFQDKFQRGTTAAPVELQESRPLVGVKWGGSFGRFATRGDLALIAAGNTNPDVAEQSIGIGNPHSGTDGYAVATIAVNMAAASPPVQTRWVPFAISQSDYRGLGLYILAGQRIGLGFFDELGNFDVVSYLPAGLSRGIQDVHFLVTRIDISGKKVSVNIRNTTNGYIHTQTWTLSDARMALLKGWNYTRIGSSDARFRIAETTTYGIVGAATGAMQEIFADKFERGTPQAPVDLKGSRSLVGGTWTGSAGQLFTRGHLQVNDNTSGLASLEQVIGVNDPHVGTDGSATATIRFNSQAVTPQEGSNTRWVPFANSASDYRGLGLYFFGWKEYATVDIGFFDATGGYTTIATFPEGTVYKNDPGQWLTVGIDIYGDRVTATARRHGDNAFITIGANLTDEQKALLVGWNFTRIGTNDRYFQMMETRTRGVVAAVTSGGGATTPGSTVTGPVTTQTVFEDQFNRGGSLTGIEAVGTQGTVGGAWQGPKTRYRVYNNSVLEAVGTPSLTDPLWALLGATPSGTDFSCTTLSRQTSNNPTVVNTYMWGLYKSNGNGLRIRTSLSQEQRVVVIEVVVGGVARTVATFPTDTYLEKTVDQTYANTLSLIGQSVEGKIGNSTRGYKTVTGTLTASEVAALSGWDRVAVATDDSRFRYDYIKMVAPASTVTTNPTPIVTNPVTTDAPKVIIYNGAAAGTRLSYHTSRVDILVPVKSSLHVLGMSMNHEDQSPAEFIKELKAEADAVTKKNGPTPFALFIPNPRFAAPDGAPASRIKDHAARVLAARLFAVSQGWGVADAYSRFAQQPDGGASWVNPLDGKHPNVFGKAAMAEVWSLFLRSLSKRI